MYTLIVNAGYPLLAIAVLAGAFGAPLPLGVALTAAGALARQGHLHLSALFIVCVIAAVAGDSLGYAAGRYGLARLNLQTRLLGRKRLRSAHAALEGLTANLGILVFLTRWALTAPAPAVNVVTGACRYPWRRFLAFDLSGEALWVAISLAPGYLLGGAGPTGIVFSLVVGIPLAILGSWLWRCLRTLGTRDAGKAISPGTASLPASL